MPPTAQTASRLSTATSVKPHTRRWLTPDVPVAPFATPVTLTADRWGALDRHYIKCERDMAIRPALQQRFINEADAFVPGKKTVVHALDTSHSPFMSAPAQLAELLGRIAG